MMPTYHIAALDHQGQPLINLNHTSPQPLKTVIVHTSWQIGTIAITDTTDHILALIACPTGHPTRKPPTIRVPLEHTE